MKIAIVGAGAMGSLFGGWLAHSGHDVTMLDVSSTTIDALNSAGLHIDRSDKPPQVVPLRATADPAEVGPVDLVLVFVKCYHTETAMRSAAPLIGPATTVLTLQNGWGNAPLIGSIVGTERVLVGLTYHSATVLAPGHIKHTAAGPTIIGELDGRPSARLDRIAEALSGAGADVVQTDQVLTEVWSKLSLNVCSLPTSALLRCFAGQLVEHDGTVELMRCLLHEVVAVAGAQGIALDEDERWEAITGLLRRASGAKSSMLQDVEHRRRTEIDVINGAVVSAGRDFGIPTPYNASMVWLVKSLEETF